MATRIILDCDPGIDDALAIAFAHGHPGIDLVGITTVAGNVGLAKTTANALAVCEFIGAAGTPVTAGCAGPLLRPALDARQVHGDSGLGGATLPPPAASPAAGHAVDYIIDTVGAAPGEITLVATGPLTNIALLLRVHPEVAPKIKEIAWMGGSTGRGNVTPYAEFNCWVDPEAAAVVVDSGIRFTMVGLNVTHQALVTPEVVDRLSAIGNTTSAFAVELLTFFRAAYQKAESMDSPPLHDPVAVALVATPDLVPTVHTRLDIELHGPETFGATSVDLHNKLGRPANAYVAVGLDADGFWKSVEDAIGRMH